MTCWGWGIRRRESSSSQQQSIDKQIHFHFRLTVIMSAQQRPIRVFYVPKQPPRFSDQQRSILQSLSSGLPPLTSSSPSFALIDELNHSSSIAYSPFDRESTLESFSKISTQESFLVKSNFKDPDVAKKESRKRLIVLIVALIVAACLIAVVTLLGIYLSNKGKCSGFYRALLSSR